MADKRNDGGPAFPVAYKRDGWEGNAGMSLRDYFAAAAMQGELAGQGPEFIDWSVDAELPDLAARCYRIADAMLKVREVSDGLD